MALVSIVMPLYNSERFIAQTINSVIDQTYLNWEMNIVDDCSTDSSPAIVKQYSQIDSRIKYICLEKNSGAAIARNKSINHANGKYIAFLDSDDIWMPDKLEKQVDFMRTHGISFSFTEYSMVNELGETIKKRVKSPDKITYRGLISGLPIMCSSVMIDQDEIRNIKMPDIRSGQDYATWALILRDRTPYAYNTGMILAKYLKQSHSLSSDKLKAFKRTWNINRDILNMNYIASSVYITVYAFRWVIKHLL